MGIGAGRKEIPCRSNLGNGFTVNVSSHFEEMTNLSKDLIAKLNEQFVVNPLKQRIVQESADGTR